MRLLVVSHPAVLAVNQLPYAELRHHGWEPWVVTPSRWRNEYAPAGFSPEELPELDGRLISRRVLYPGRQQRHAYVTRIGRLINDIGPDVAFVEQEPTSVAAFQWARALAAAGVPFGLQCDENLDRRRPAPARVFRRFTLARAAFVAARSPAAAALARRARPGLPTPLIPHHVPAWPPMLRPEREGFVIGYAGRLVPEKGLDVLVEAAAGISGAVVRLVGDGPMRAQLQAQAAERGLELEIDTTVRHADMPSAYATFDVLALPSLTTHMWAEQFGRVLVEALWCGVPVIGSDSGEIPWVLSETHGGMVVPEGDAVALRAALVRLRDTPALRRELAGRGSERARALFSVEAVATALDRALRAAVQGEAPSSA